ncbi:hypothetical protein [Sphingomonas lacusdianchii]|uniref:hypothetical protein n=1 Tax=Sphingomonas lacusdianchii TaxID=2917992 RepID=UPI001F579F60|nr:hypothetical protein [Sphingomonas sp. JXJ CY 53]
MIHFIGSNDLQQVMHHRRLVRAKESKPGAPLTLIGGTTISPKTWRIASAEPPPTRASAMPNRCYT